MKTVTLYITFSFFEFTSLITIFMKKKKNFYLYLPKKVKYSLPAGNSEYLKYWPHDIYSIMWAITFCCFVFSLPYQIVICTSNVLFNWIDLFTRWPSEQGNDHTVHWTIHVTISQWAWETPWFSWGFQDGPQSNRWKCIC